MPAMPKEKSSIIAEINYAELNMKDNMMASVRKELSPNDTASPTTVSANKTDSNKCAGMADAHHHLARSTPTATSNKSTPNKAAATYQDSNKMSSSKSPANSDPSKSRTPHDYRFGKSIGEGSFSTVYLAKDIHTHKEYASK